MEATLATTLSAQSYLIFRLGNEKFALEVHNTQSILKLSALTKIPKAPEYLRGVLNLTGQALPVIDLNCKLSGTLTEFSDNTCILVTEIVFQKSSVRFGLIVDDVYEVTEIEPGGIIQAKNLGILAHNEYVTGIIEDDDKFIMLLNVDKLLTDSDIKVLLSQTDNKIKTKK